MAASCSAGLRGEGKGKAGHCAAVRARGAPRGQSECGTSTPQSFGHSQRPAAPPQNRGLWLSFSSVLRAEFHSSFFPFSVLFYFILPFYFCLSTPFFLFLLYLLFCSLFFFPLFFPPPVPGQGGAAQPARPPGPGRLSAAIAERGGGGKDPVPLPLSTPTPLCPLAFPLLHLGESCWIAAGSQWSPGAGDYGPRRAPRPFPPGKNRGRSRAGPGAGGEAAGRGQGPRAGPGVAFALSLPPRGR